ncbi:MAG: lipoyl(octanoyl) transferase LipB [Dehalococcoidia bacterium]
MDTTATRSAANGGAATRPLVVVRDLGLTRYADALALQRNLHERRKRGEMGDTLLLTQHRPVFTLGSGADRANLLAPEAEVRRRGIEVAAVERGGDITYHGPGQLVAYPILDLRGFGRDVHRYIRGLEQTALDLLAAYGLTGARQAGAPGVRSVRARSRRSGSTSAAG